MRRELGKYWFCDMRIEFGKYWFCDMRIELGKYFFTIWEVTLLKRHVSVHTGTIPLMCKFVRMNYKLWVHLKAQERVHTK